MDSWSTSREVEKVKPFADRALACVAKLRQQREAMQLVFGNHGWLVATIGDAEAILNEAVARGVKGKEPKP